MNPYTRTMRALFAIYSAAALLGVVIISLHNVYINGIGWQQYTVDIFPVKLGMGVALVVIFQTASLWMLRPARAYWAADSRRPAAQEATQRAAAWRSIARLPLRIYWSMVVYGLIASPTYHSVTAALNRNVLTDMSGTQSYIILENLLFDQSIALMLAALLYSLLNRAAHEALQKLNEYELHEQKLATIVRPMLTSFSSLFLISIFALLWFVANRLSAGQHIPLAALAAVIAVVTVSATALFAVQALELHGRFHFMIREVRRLIGQSGKTPLGKVPVTSTDEAGLLTAAFNELQQHSASEYDALERELALAGQVQRKLLPPPSIGVSGAIVAGFCLPSREIGGDFYDIVRFDERRSAVLIGDVAGKGMQAAIVMSAVVALTRAEVRRGGDPADVLARLNRSITSDALTYAHVFVTMGIAFICADNDGLAVEYASAGHMSPYMLRHGQLEELECGSLPLGIDADARYRTLRLSLLPGERIILYTDGVTEAPADDHSIIGFDVLERQLRLLVAATDNVDDAALSVKRWLTEELDRTDHIDDQTVVLIEARKGGEAACRPTG